MNEVICLIKEETTIENKDYYLIQESISKKEHFIPRDQIFKNAKQYSEYNFLKEVNPKRNFEYLSIIHPEFTIGQEKILSIIKFIEDGNLRFFELESDFRIPLTVKAFAWQKSFTEIKCKVVGYKKGIPKLKNIDNRNDLWKEGDIISLKIQKFGQILDRNGILIDVVCLELPDSKDIIKIRTQPWQNKSEWNFDDITCEVVGISQNGLPKLRTYDSRHPHYVIGETYEFTIEEFRDKSLKTGGLIKVIKLIDKFNNQQEVLAIPNQENRLKKGDVIECRIENINSRIHLRQVNTKDPFFYKFHDIINDEILEKKYFTYYLNDKGEYNLRLKTQYEQESAFWVFTYCNYILTKIKNEESRRRNLKSVLQIINLHNKIENWIISKGILRAITNSDERKRIKTKTNFIILNNELEKSAIEYILNFKHQEFYSDQLKNLNFNEVYFFLKHANFDSFNELEFLKFITKIKTIDKDQKHPLTKLKGYIHRSVEVYKSSMKQEYFIFSHELNPIQKKEITKYLNWIYIQIIICDLINSVEDSNILKAKFYRINTYLIRDKIVNEKLLLNAFFIISNPSNEHKIPVEIRENRIHILINEIKDNPNTSKPLRISDDYTTINVVQKHYNGFKCKKDEVNGFLPHQNIYDRDLKYFLQDNLNWETNVKIILYCAKFQFFICQQLNKSSKNYLSNNLNFKSTLTRGEIFYGIIKNVATFSTGSIGIFLSTKYGDGLLHQNEVSDDLIDPDEIKSIFTSGDKIPVYLIGYSGDNLTLGFKQLIGTHFEQEYYEIIHNYDYDIDIELTEEDLNEDFHIEIEKGFIYQQFAYLQESIDEKVKYIKFSKAFFSKTKNARSYLLNIYIEYFNSIKQLDNLLQDYSIEKYEDFRKFILPIKDKIQPQTLDSFPESKNLVFFIDILLFFNSRDENTLESIFELVKKSINENEISLKAVAKTVLSNNLILTEINDSDIESLNDFTLNNLKRIREYIGEGVLSVKESIEDKREKELSEKRNYWLKTINEDEGEKLEFKATLKTPVPTNEQNRIITAMENQLKKAESKEKAEIIKKRIQEQKDFTKNVKDIEKKIIHSALKTICAFANTKGGHLLLGVTDDKKIFGLEQDYESLKSIKKDRDGFGQYFDQLIKEYFGESFSSTLLEVEFLKFPKGDILIVKVKESSEEVFLLKNEYGQNDESLYVRNLSSSKKLKGIELSKFIKNKYRSQILNKAGG